MAAPPNSIAPHMCLDNRIHRATNNLSRLARIALLALLIVQHVWRSAGQTVTIDTSPAGQRQVIDGFGTCLSGTEASQTTWWTNLYYGDLQASMLRMDLTPNFNASYSANNYNSPSYGNPGPQGNYVRAYTNATTYTNLFNGSQAQIAVMGPNIDSNIAYFDFSASGSGQQVAGMTAQLGKSLITNLGDFKLFASLWSPMPWIKLVDGNTYESGGSDLPTNGTPFPFIWLGNFSGGSLDTSGTPRPEFNDSALGGTGPTGALTQFARCMAAYLRGFQNTYGVSFYAISIQNELDFDEFYNSCFYPSTSGYLAALTAVRAELNQYPDLAGIKIMGPEDVLGGDPYGMWQYGSGSTAAAKNLQFLQAVGANSNAATAEAYFCIHGYDSDGVSAAAATPTQWLWWVNGWTSSPDPGIPANVPGFSAYGKKSWMTETSGENPAWLYPTNGFPSGGAWSIALRIQQALTAGQESAWAYWQMTDGSSVGTETLTDSSLLGNSPKYIAARHFFRYIRPNAVCVNATVSGYPELAAAAFLHPTNGTMTVVLINATNTSVQAVVNTPAQPSGITTWQTFTSSNGSYWQAGTSGITNGQASVTVPGYGVVTLYGMAPPRLTGALTAGKQLSLAWPPSANGFQLQSTTNLNSSWRNVPSGQVTIVGLSSGLVSATITTTNSPVFFRLMQP
jgi:O-glycosyl hydrolase